jgi:hypothetical protein
MPLSTVPLLRDGGWDAVLVGTPLAGIALQAVTLQQVFTLADAGGGTTYPLLAALTLADIDLASTPLRSSPLQAFLFSGPKLAQLSPTKAWCSAVPVGGCDPNTFTLLDLSLAGASAIQLRFVSGLAVSAADLTGSPIAQYDVGSVNVVAAGLGGLTFSQLPAGMVTCDATACPTLADAVAANKISTDPTLSAFGNILRVPSLVGTATLEDLIKGVIDPTKVSYAGVDLAALANQGPFDPSRLVTYTASATVACAAGFGLSLTVGLPVGFRVRPGSSRITIGTDGNPQPIADPVPVIEPVGEGGNNAARGPVSRWNASAAACDGTSRNPVALSFDASPGVVLGTFTSSADFASSQGSGQAVNTAPVTVIDALEGNDDVAHATVLDVGSLYVSHISTPSDVDFYRLPAGLPAGTQVTAVLSHLPADFDLFLDGPAAAPLRSSPLRSSPLRSSPIEDLGLNGAPGGDVLQPDTLQDTPLRSSVLSQSASASRTDEQVNTVLTAPTTADRPVTLEVTNHLGSSSASPYLLQVTTSAPPVLSCPTAASPFTGSSGVAGTLPNINGLSTAQKAAKKTLFLVDAKRLGDAYSKAEADAVVAKLTTLSGRPEVGGVIVPVEGSSAVAAAYAAWDANRCDPEKANDVVRAIGAVVDGYAAQLPQLRYLTFVGDDDIVPFARIPDGATVSNQLDYYPQVVFNAMDNPISAAFGRGYLLSDNPLLAKNGISFLGHQLAVPDFAGGRLVETPTEIIGTIDQYTLQPNITLNRTLVTGYDFMTDDANALDATLAARQAGIPGATHVKLTDTWNKADLATALAAAPTVAGLNGHYDHSRAEPALGTDLFSSTELLSSGLPASALLFTLGCEGGLSVPNRAWAAASSPAELARLLDFAQALARKKANGFLGNTGYGYGDTVAIAYSERLLDLFTKNLDGTMTLSQAVSKAKQDYLKDGLVGVYDEKVLNESTFYGLPFVTVGPSGVAAPAPAAPAADATGTSPFLGTPARTFSKTLSYAAVGTPRGSYYTVVDSQPLIEHYRPIQPATTQELPAPPAGTQVGDLWFTDLVSLPDEAALNPVFSMPTVDNGAFSPEPLIKHVDFPVSLGTVTPRGSVALFPGQFRSDDSIPGTGTQLRFSSMTYKVFYPSTVDAARPVFTQVDATSTGAGTQFRVGATDAQNVGVLYRQVGHSDWVTTMLTQLSPGVWVGSVGVQVQEYLVQAVNDGRVGTTRAKGVDYVPSPTPVTTTTVAPTPTGTPPWFRQPVVVDVAGGGYQGSVDGAPFAALPLTISTDGVHRVDIRSGPTVLTTLAVPIDQTAPTVTITSPGPGSAGLAPALSAGFTCNDLTSGIASCTALDPLDNSPGTHTYRVKAVDRAGNETTATATYQGTTYTFKGFFSPVDNAPTLNVVQPGSNVPLKFRLLVDGKVVTTTASIASITVTQLASCAAGAGASTVPSAVPGGVRYNAEDQIFQYNWKTPKRSTGCQQLTFTFDNGTSKYALFRFKKGDSDEPDSRNSPDD